MAAVLRVHAAHPQRDGRAAHLLQQVHVDPIPGEEVLAWLRAYAHSDCSQWC